MYREGSMLQKLFFLFSITLKSSSDKNKKTCALLFKLLIALIFTFHVEEDNRERKLCLDSALNAIWHHTLSAERILKGKHYIHFVAARTAPIWVIHVTDTDFTD